ncbi:phage tail family protein [Clostridium botulinum]|nr:phage tail family protein [Clostridium botulinum]NFJ88495.1 phage tail family protein [Clostridium botulinum]HDI3121689.1 phage tail family protein [Clostridium botulinum]
MLKMINKNGKEVTFNSQLPFLIQEFKDDGVGVEIHSTKSFMRNGQDYNYNILETRQLTLKFMIEGQNEQELRDKIKLINNVVNPILGEVLIIYENKCIKAIADNTLSLEENEKTNINLYENKIRFVCSDPFWKDIGSTKLKLCAFVNKFKFPFHFPVKMGGKANKITNILDGDAETSIKIKFTGNMVNPILFNNTTGDFIKLNCKLTENDVVEIDTDYKTRCIKLNGTSNFSILDFNSTLFQLGIGENELEFKSDKADSKAKIEIEYKNNYISCE